MTTILSLVGDQTLPNVLFIKALPKADGYWFVETQKTFDDYRVDSIMEAISLSKSEIKTYKVLPDGLFFEPPSDWKLSGKDDLIINLTGGTKMMALSVFRYYQQFENARFYYIPIGNDAAISLSAVHFPIKLPAIDLHTYLLSHGYMGIHHPPDPRQKSFAYNLFRQVMTCRCFENVPLIRRAKSDAYTGSDKQYLLGAWFEDYMYWQIKETLDLPESQVGRAVKLQNIISKSPTESDHELDVVFMWEGRLHVVECKVFNKVTSGKDLGNAIYKLGTINKTLGLHATGIICILAEIGVSPQRTEKLNYLKRISGVKTIVSLENFLSEKNVMKLFNLK